MSRFCPWGVSALDRQPELKNWIATWFEKPDFFSPKDWFVRGHDHLGGKVNKYKFWEWNIKSGNMVWTPPPAAADAALEELRKARIKRQRSTHLVIIPNLFTHLWKKQLLKACDLTFEIPAKYPFWQELQHEGLTVGICFPFLNVLPWQLRGTPKMFFYQRELCKVFKEAEVDGRDLLLQLFMDYRRWHAMPQSLVRKVLFFSN